jgi:hypothetical protein
MVTVKAKPSAAPPTLLSKYSYPAFPQSSVVASRDAPTHAAPCMLQLEPVPVSSAVNVTVMEPPVVLQYEYHSEFSTENGTSCKPSPSRSAPA